MSKSNPASPFRRQEARSALLLVLSNRKGSEPIKNARHTHLRLPVSIDSDSLGKECSRRVILGSYGGRYVLPHEAEIEALEGNWKPNRLILIEFEDADQARQWWESPQYAEARAIHHAATISNVILVNVASHLPTHSPGDVMPM